MQFTGINGKVIKPTRVITIYLLKNYSDKEWTEVTEEEYVKAEKAVGISFRDTPSSGAFSAKGIEGSTGWRYEND